MRRPTRVRNGADTDRRVLRPSVGESPTAAGKAPPGSVSADLTDAELTAFIKARLTISGFDPSLLPTTYDLATGVPTQDSLIGSLLTFVKANPGALNTWRPPSPVGGDQYIYQQQVAPPPICPSITEAWTGKVRG